jgi:spore germination protein GerM
VAWRAGNEIVEFEQRVPQTQAIGAAALNELLNGPVDGNAAGAQTALPSVQEIIAFAGRDETWGYRVQLLNLVIENGVATADFSQELRAYGGDPARAGAIREQIERTLLQFPSVQRVVILIDGDANAWQP